MSRKMCLVLCMAIVVAACHKSIDQPNNPDPPAPGCKVTAIYSESGGYVDSTYIGYNSSGQPITITYNTLDFDFNIANSHVFNYNYDHLNRLVSQTSDWVYSEDQIYYAYEGNSTQPVRDTIPKIFGQVIVEDFDYDSFGRIIKIVRRTVSQWEDDSTVYPTENYKYTYDADGNRQEDPANPNYPGVIQYSDKPSLYSLNPVWQIVHKDFSRNSVLYADSYNDKGLPLTIKADPPGYFQPFLTVTPGAHIEYECE